ncbi:unnamed protein product [Dicrocoelium dendriticum]|nr:unnamed protein product [Dicrocoelium dendriticum]
MFHLRILRSVCLIVAQRFRHSSALPSNISGRLWRSFLYVPGDRAKMIQKIIDSTALLGSHQSSSHIPDLTVLDCEDAVALDQKLADAIETKLDHAFALQQRPALGLIAMIESCTAVLNLPGICKASRSLKVPLQCVVFGSDDYCVSLGVERSNENTELSYARQFIPVVARAFGLSSIDMVDIDYKDMDKLTVNCRRGAQLGFTGKQTIHPAQLPVVNSSFAPSPARIEWSKALLAEAAKHSVSNDGVSAGAFSFRGRMIDRPTLRQARYIIEMSQLLNLQVNSS